MKGTYAYKAWTPSGTTTHDTLRAIDEADALRQLREKHLVPIDTPRELGAGFDWRTWFRARPVERIPFFRSMASLLSAGINHNTAFTLLLDQVTAVLAHQRVPWRAWRTRRFRAVVAGLRTDIANGAKISAAMEARPHDFSDVEVAIVAAGERAGGAEHVLSNLATHLEKGRKFASSMQSMLVYPAIVCITLVIFIAIMALFVIPRFATYFASMNVPLPLSFQLFLTLGSLVRQPLVDLLALVTLGSLLVIAARALQSPHGAQVFDRLRMRIPFVGTLIKKNITIVFANVLRMLYAAGEIPITCLETMTRITDSPAFSRAIIEARNALADGHASNLADALQATNVWEPFFIGFVRIGEESGNLPEMLAKAAEYYETDVATLVTQIPLIIQVLVIIALGIAVGSVIVPIYTSIFSLAATLH